MRARILSALLLALPMTACTQSDPTPPVTTSSNAPVPQTALGRTVDKAMQEARRELATGNISISDGIRVGSTGQRAPSGDLPKAEITPAGDLLVDGAPVPIDAGQRELLLEYRGHVVAIAEAGMAIGVQGADLGMKAAGDAIASIFSGAAEGVEARVEAQAAGLKAEAARLCAQLAPMLATQRELAARLPAFAPYATMTQADVDKCMSDTGEAKHATRAEVRERIRSGIRDTVRAAPRAAAEAASDTPASDPQDPAATR